ncbi:MAG: family 2 glycosyl transferase [Spirulinaceae cyanobacterium SM2_1_0]|nr:family 2 glycosyl transferase [Spirulinaceae cyanobacterium SM2_1_0]
MRWEVRVRNARGRERVLQTYETEEAAIRHVDAIYAEYGYPMHLAYRACPAFGQRPSLVMASA